MIYLKLFWSFLQIGLFSFGGGYTTLPLIQQQVVIDQHWLTMKEYTDVITISQMTPGPIAINAATFVGIKIAGIGGAVIATLGCILPTSIIVLVIAHYYYQYSHLTVVEGIFNGLRPAVVAMIAAAGISILFLSLFNVEVLSGPIQFDWKAVVLFGISLIVLRKFKINPIYIMMACGAIGVVVYYLL